MAPRATLTSNGHISLDDIVGSLVDNGAVNLRIDPRTGDTGAGVTGYFFIEFNDSGGENRLRHLFGFHANPNDRNEYGWTRVQLGADDRGHTYIRELGETVGGQVKDDRNGQIEEFEPRPTFGMVA